MLIWREQQEPIVSVMNRAEHFLVSANFLMVAGYADDAIKLSQTPMNQPDRNCSYSADEAQKDAYAALVNMHASRIQLEIEKENSIGMSWAEIAAQRAKNLVFACRPGAQRGAPPLCLQTSRYYKAG